MRCRPAFLAFCLLAAPASAEAPVGFPVLQLHFSDNLQAEPAAEMSEHEPGPFSPTRRFALGFDSQGDRQATYASAGVGFEFGSLDVGRPRSVLEIGLVAPRPGSDNGLRPLASEAALDERLGPGLVLNAGTGTFSLGTSFHRTDEVDDISILGLAGRLDLPTPAGLDRVAVYGGAETDGSTDRLRLGTEVSRGRAVVGLDMLRDNGEDGYSLGQVYVGVTPTPEITLGISGARQFSSEVTDEDATRFGLGASYNTGDGAFVRGGIADAAGEEPAFDLSVGFQF